jgi:hypothetical protein
MSERSLTREERWLWFAHPIAGNVADRLPGSPLTALASGGTDVLSYGGAMALGAAYGLLAVGLSMLVVRRRDITD